MKIRYLLLHAYGMGGTIRTVFNQASAMAAAGHDVEIVSVVRRRTKPQFPLDPRVRISTLVDQRDGYGPDSLWRRIRRKLRGRVVPSDEFAARYFTERVERATIDAVANLDDGILVTTRPALNIIGARFAPRHIVHVVQEHMNLATHKPDTKRHILKYYPRADAVVVLTNTDREEYRKALPGTRIERIPNSTALDRPQALRPEQQDRHRRGAALQAEGLRPAHPRVRPGGRGPPRLAAAHLRHRPAPAAAAGDDRGARPHRARAADGPQRHLRRRSWPRPRCSCSAPASRACPW